MRLNKKILFENLRLRLVYLNVRIYKIELQNYITFNSKGIKEAINQNVDNFEEKVNILENIVENIKKSQFVTSAPDNKSNPMINKYHYFKVESLKYWIVIREMKDGKCIFYDIVDKFKYN